MLYEIFADCSLAALLLVAIAYCRKLNGKLKRLRHGEKSMLDAADKLNQAVADANRALKSLSSITTGHTRDIPRQHWASGASAQPDPLPDRALRRRLG